jgi:hypothetical protein
MRNCLSPYVTGALQALRLALLAGLLGLAGIAVAADPGSASSSGGATTTYRWVDAQGVVHYSDTPQPGAQKLEIAPAQTFQFTANPGASSAAANDTSPGQYTACLITQPQPQQSFYAPESVPVTVQLAPGRRSGDLVQVTYDGTPVSATDDSGTNFQIDMPDRGQHTVTATVMDSTGRTVCTSEPVIFYVQRPSLDSPHSPAATHPGGPPIPGR